MGKVRNIVRELRDLAERIRYNVEPRDQLAARADALADRLEAEEALRRPDPHADGADGATGA